ncbi:MAG: 50S ribosomal protein L11 methyltransferase [Candidatus Binatia bacterium]
MGETAIFKKEPEDRRREEAEKEKRLHALSDSPIPGFPDSSSRGAPPSASCHSLSLTNSQHPAPNTQHWHCLSLTVPHEATEVIANFLVELGAIGVVEGSRDFQQPATPTTDVQGFFTGEIEGEALVEALTRYIHDLAGLFPHFETPSPQLTKVTNEAWQDSWREHFPPIAVGKRFLLLPPWESPPADTDRTVIVIDPSMAFGTGHHGTTQGCLAAIELLYEQYGAPDRALDLGTGSGILAIALAKLGARRLWATDIDPIALTEAQKNSEANHVADSIQLSDLPIEHLPHPFALIVANLFSATLVSLASTFVSALTPHGHLILSGIQLDQEHEVLTAYSAPAWKLVTRFPKEEWVTLLLQRVAG